VCLVERDTFKSRFVIQRCEHTWQVAHGGAVSSAVGRGGGRGCTLQHVAAYAPPAGVPDINRAAVHPLDVGISDYADILQPAVEQGIAERETELGVIGHLAGFQAQPAATDYVAVRVVDGGYFPRRHKFHRGAQCIAHREAEVGSEGALRECWECIHLYVTRKTGRVEGTAHASFI